MAVKSIIDIEINDGAFKEFAQTYAKYEEALKDSPNAWAKVNKEIDGTSAGFADLVALQIAMIAKEELLAKARKEAERLTRSQADSWRGMAKSSKDFLGNVAEATKSLLRWASLTSVVGGLLGAGGLFGIDRLATSAGNARRSSQGQGLTTGEQRAFGVNFGRVVDAPSFLSNINAALHDQSLRYTLYGAGLSEGQIAGKDTGQVGAAALASIKQLVDRTPDAQLAQVLQSRGLNNTISLEDAVRLKSLSSEEFGQLQSGYQRDRSQLGFADQTAKAWQDFAAQMTRAGDKIESIFVDKLSGLAGPLTDLSDSFTKAISSLADSGKLKEWIGDLGKGIEYTAQYLGSDEFQNDVRSIVEDMASLAKAIVNGLQWLGIIPAKNANVTDSPDNTATTQLPGATIRWGSRNPFTGKWSGDPEFHPGDDHGTVGAPLPPSANSNNNPGNLRAPGSKTGFQSFATQEEGIRALANQLQRYEDVYGLDTIRKMAYRYAPPGENDTEAWIKNVSKASGFSDSEHVNLHDKAVLARLEAAVTKAEGKAVPQQVVITVLNNTGGNAVVSASQVAR